MVRVDGRGDGNSLVRARGLDKTYRRGGEEIQVLQRLNLDVDKGDFVAFMGPSGSGKTTFLTFFGAPASPTKATTPSPATRSRTCPAISSRSGAPAMSASSFRCTTLSLSSPPSKTSSSLCCSP